MEFLGLKCSCSPHEMSLISQMKLNFEFFQTVSAKELNFIVYSLYKTSYNVPRDTHDIIWRRLTLKPALKDPWKPYEVYTTQLFFIAFTLHFNEISAQQMFMKLAQVSLIFKEKIRRA